MRDLKVNHYDENLCPTAKIGAKIYHVKGAIENETVNTKEYAVDGKHVYSQVTEVIKASEHRITPKCDLCDACGSCTLMHVDYNEQLSVKKRHIQKILSSVVTPDIVEDTVGLSQFAGRNKLHLVFGGKVGNVRLGFFNSATKKVVDVKSCVCHPDWYQKLYTVLKTWADEDKLAPYDPKTSKGLVRFAAARVLDDNIMLTLVVTSEKLCENKDKTTACIDSLYSKLKDSFDSVSLWLNLNKERTNEVMSGRIEHLKGEKTLRATMLGTNIVLRPTSFFQVNTEIASRIYSDVLELSKKSGSCVMVDCFSGIGVTSLLFSKYFEKVISIEIVQSAVACAKDMARLNNVQNIEFICADANKVLPTLKIGAQSTFFVDPPRAGLGEKICRSILKFAPSQIVYLSCNPQTLKRDLEFLCGEKYKVELVRPYDMFPNTKHIETLVVLKRLI